MPRWGRLFTINYRRALPYAMIFCPFRALRQCIDKRHNVKPHKKRNNQKKINQTSTQTKLRKS
ncbi:MAG: hypothetical protein LBQ66_13560 [Planctomycetaceae bacterium]|nr:hypothetical protein [Planctomycetaceae bacterium]